MRAPKSSGKRSWWLFAAITAAVFVEPASARAAVEVQLDPARGSAFSALIGKELETLRNEIEAEINTQYHALEPQKYLRTIADASSFSNKGLGVDYASNPTLFVVGVGAGIGVGFGDKGLDELKEDRALVGAAPNISAMAGLNLGFLGYKEWTVFLNGMSLNVPVGRWTKQIDEQLQSFEASFKNFGAHVQYKLFAPSRALWQLLVQWGGIDVTAGLEYSRFRLTLDDDLTTQMNLNDAQRTEITYKSHGNMALTMTSWNIPVEITTNLRLLYLVTFYTGVGFDIKAGQSKINATLDGPVYGKVPETSEQYDLGNAKIRLNEKSGPSGNAIRFLGGLQFNVWMIKVFTQINMGLPRAISGAAGVRIAW